MKLNVKNFAKIDHASINMNGITVVAGENSTGKSTLGKIMYSVFSSFYNINNKVASSRKNQILRILSNLDLYNEADGEFYDLDLVDMGVDVNKLYDDILAIDDSLPKEQSLEVLKSILSDYLSHDTIGLISNLDDSLNNLYRVMMLKDDLLRRNLVLSTFNREFHNQFMPLYQNCEETNIDLTIKDSHINITFFEDDVMINQFLPIIQKGIYLDSPLLLDELNTRTPFYLRQMLNGFGENHAEEMIDKLRHSVNNSLIDQTISTQNTLRIKAIIKEIIHGDFVTESHNVKFRENGINEPLRVENLSTGVKSFATILRILENGHITENGFMILDEPEVNLHPMWQLKYAELLVKMQKELNLHILLASHSPYFINAIEVYSKKEQIQDKCNFYLAKLNENNKAQFIDVTNDTSPIFDKLSIPFDELDRILLGL